MALLEVVETGQERIEVLRTELGRVREALDRADSVLEVADETLDRAEAAIVQSRKAAPFLLIALGVVAVGGIAAVVIIRRRRDWQRLEDSPDVPEA